MRRAPLYRADDCHVDGLPAVRARSVMFGFVVIISPVIFEVRRPAIRATVMYTADYFTLSSTFFKLIFWTVNEGRRARTNTRAAFVRRGRAGRYLGLASAVWVWLAARLSRNR